MTSVGNTDTATTTIQAKQVVAGSQRLPTFNIVVDTVDFNKDGYSATVNRVMVDETIDKISYAEIVLANNSMDMSTDDLFSPNKEMTITTGFQGDTYEVRDVFETVNPLFRVSRSGIIIMRGFSTGIIATRDGRQTVYYNKTHSDIANEIAGFYNWGKDIDATRLSYPQIMQAGKTDYQLLKEMSFLNGFDFYISNNILHFHGLREEKPIALYSPTMIYSGEFEIESEGRAVTVGISEYDPLKGTVFNVNSIDSGKSVINENGTDVVGWDDLSAIRKLFLVDAGQFLTKGEAQLFVDGLQNAGRYVVRANIKAMGNELIHPRSLVEIMGMGRFSGVYYVREVTHTIQNNDYICDLVIVRAFIEKAVREGILIGASGSGIPTSGGKMDVTNKSKSAGTVVS